MKKLVISISLALISLTTVFLCGCTNNRYTKNPWENKKEENGFYYFLKGEKGGVAGIGNKVSYAVILGYANTIDTFEELVIPEKLGGYFVKEIGYAWTPVMSAPTTYYGINAKDVNRIVINHKLTLSSCGLKNFAGDLIINNELINYSALSGYTETLSEVNRVVLNCVVKEESLMRYDQYGKTTMKYHKYCLFNAKEGQQKTYAEVIKDGLVNEPQAPTKEGFIFDGWFTDETFKTKWDFENDKVNENITLYAKWI